jgi:hypothetical protein
LDEYNLVLNDSHVPQTEDTLYILLVSGKCEVEKSGKEEVEELEVVRGAGRISFLLLPQKPSTVDDVVYAILRSLGFPDVNLTNHTNFDLPVYV